MTAYVMGITMGVLVGLLVLLIVKKKKGKREYDERQMAGRGIAFRNGFFTLLILEAICTMADMLEGLPVEPYLWHYCSMIIGIGIFALTAIHYDAYIGLRENPKQFMTSGFLLAIGTFCSGIAGLHKENRFYIVSFMLSLLWIIILVAMTIHNRKGLEE